MAELLSDYQSSRGDILKDVASELAKTTPIHLKPDERIDRHMNIS
jgi:hypothetical protein